MVTESSWLLAVEVLPSEFFDTVVSRITHYQRPARPAALLGNQVQLYVGRYNLTARTLPL